VRTLAAAALLALAAAGLSGAVKPPYSAEQVLKELLAAQDSQAAFSAQLRKEERRSGHKKADAWVQGELAMMPGGRAWLRITEPSPGRIVCDGKRLNVELPEAKQVMRYDAKKLRASGNFFLDLAASIRHYSMGSLRRLVPPGKGFDPKAVSALELVPEKPATAGFEQLLVWVDHQDWLVLRAQLTYAGTVTSVEFKGAKAYTAAQLKKDAQAPRAALFEYKAPAGWEVFDLDL
jgi:outer membrane lipoprotein-sorting protein